jgi:hypothetical protein
MEDLNRIIFLETQKKSIIDHIKNEKLTDGQINKLKKIYIDHKKEKDNLFNRLLNKYDKDEILNYINNKKKNIEFINKMSYDNFKFPNNRYENILSLEKYKNILSQIKTHAVQNNSKTLPSILSLEESLNNVVCKCVGEMHDESSYSCNTIKNIHIVDNNDNNKKEICLHNYIYNLNKLTKKNIQYGGYDTKQNHDSHMELIGKLDDIIKECSDLLTIGDDKLEKIIKKTFKHNYFKSIRTVVYPAEFIVILKKIMIMCNYYIVHIGEIHRCHNNHHSVKRSYDRVGSFKLCGLGSHMVHPSGYTDEFVKKISKNGPIDPNYKFISTENASRSYFVLNPENYRDGNDNGGYESIFAVDAHNKLIKLYKKFFSETNNDKILIKVYRALRLNNVQPAARYSLDTTTNNYGADMLTFEDPTLKMRFLLHGSPTSTDYLYLNPGLKLGADVLVPTIIKYPEGDAPIKTFITNQTHNREGIDKFTNEFIVDPMHNGDVLIDKYIGDLYEDMKTIFRYINFNIGSGVTAELKLNKIISIHNNMKQYNKESKDKHINDAKESAILAKELKDIIDKCAGIRYDAYEDVQKHKSYHKANIEDIFLDNLMNKNEEWKKMIVDKDSPWKIIIYDNHNNDTMIESTQTFEKILPYKMLGTSLVTQFETVDYVEILKKNIIKRKKKSVPEKFSEDEKDDDIIMMVDPLFDNLGEYKIDPHVEPRTKDKQNRYDLSLTEEMIKYYDGDGPESVTAKLKAYDDRYTEQNVKDSDRNLQFGGSNGGEPIFDTFNSVLVAISSDNRNVGKNLMKNLESLNMRRIRDVLKAIFDYNDHDPTIYAIDNPISSSDQMDPNLPNALYDLCPDDKELLTLLYREKVQFTDKQGKKYNEKKYKQKTVVYPEQPTSWFGKITSIVTTEQKPKHYKIPLLYYMNKYYFDYDQSFPELYTFANSLNKVLMTIKADENTYAKYHLGVPKEDIDIEKYIINPNLVSQIDDIEDARDASVALDNYVMILNSQLDNIGAQVESLNQELHEVLTGLDFYIRFHRTIGTDVGQIKVKINRYRFISHGRVVYYYKILKQIYDKIEARDESIVIQYLVQYHHNIIKRLYFFFKFLVVYPDVTKAIMTHDENKIRSETGDIKVLISKIKDLYYNIDSMCSDRIKNAYAPYWHDFNKFYFILDEYYLKTKGNLSIYARINDFPTKEIPIKDEKGKTNQYGVIIPANTNHPFDIGKGVDHYNPHYDIEIENAANDPENNKKFVFYQAEAMTLGVSLDACKENINKAIEIYNNSESNPVIKNAKDASLKQLDNIDNKHKKNDIPTKIKFTDIYDTKNFPYNQDISQYMGISNKIMDGQGVMMLTYGYSGTGKTVTLFGIDEKNGGILASTLDAITSTDTEYGKDPIIMFRAFEIYGLGNQFKFYWENIEKWFDMEKDIDKDDDAIPPYQKIFVYNLDASGDHLRVVRDNNNKLTKEISDTYGIFAHIAGVKDPMKSGEYKQINRNIYTNFKKFTEEIDKVRINEGHQTGPEHAPLHKTTRIKPTPNNPQSSRSIIVYDFQIITNPSKPNPVSFVICDLPGKEEIYNTYLTKNYFAGTLEEEEEEKEEKQETEEEENHRKARQVSYVMNPMLIPVYDNNSKHIIQVLNEVFPKNKRQILEKIIKKWLLSKISLSSPYDYVPNEVKVYQLFDKVDAPAYIAKQNDKKKDGGKIDNIDKTEKEIIDDIWIEINNEDDLDVAFRNLINMRLKNTKFYGGIAEQNKREMNLLDAGMPFDYAAKLTDNLEYSIYDILFIPLMEVFMIKNYYYIIVEIIARCLQSLDKTIDLSTKGRGEYNNIISRIYSIFEGYYINENVIGILKYLLRTVKFSNIIDETDADNCLEKIIDKQKKESNGINLTEDAIMKHAVGLAYCQKMLDANNPKQNGTRSFKKAVFELDNLLGEADGDSQYHTTTYPVNTGSTINQNQSTNIQQGKYRRRQLGGGISSENINQSGGTFFSHPETGAWKKYVARYNLQDLIKNADDINEKNVVNIQTFVDETIIEYNKNTYNSNALFSWRKPLITDIIEPYLKKTISYELYYLMSNNDSLFKCEQQINLLYNTYNFIASVEDQDADEKKNLDV